SRLCGSEASRRQGRVIAVLYACAAGSVSGEPARHRGGTSWCRPTAGGGFKTISLPRSVINPPPRHRRRPRRWVYVTFSENSVIIRPVSVGGGWPGAGWQAGVDLADGVTPNPPGAIVVVFVAMCPLSVRVGACPGPPR